MRYYNPDTLGANFSAPNRDLYSLLFISFQLISEVVCLFFFLIISDLLSEEERVFLLFIPSLFHNGDECLKGVIIAAGYGTRFLPVTKTIPKEMLPVIDVPTIEFTIREFVESGITDIQVVTSRRKKALEDYFDKEIELEAIFTKNKASEKLKLLKSAENLASIQFVRQKEMKGTAHAILLAKSFVGNDPFIVAYPDDFFLSDIPVTKQLIAAHKATGKNVLVVFVVLEKEVFRYGIIHLG